MVSRGGARACSPPQPLPRFCLFGRAPVLSQPVLSRLKTMRETSELEPREHYLGLHPTTAEAVFFHRERLFSHIPLYGVIFFSACIQSSSMLRISLAEKRRRIIARTLHFSENTAKIRGVQLEGNFPHTPVLFTGQRKNIAQEERRESYGYRNSRRLN